MNKGEFQICPFITKKQKQKQSPMEAKGNVNTSYCTENKQKKAMHSQSTPTLRSKFI